MHLKANKRIGLSLFLSGLGTVKTEVLYIRRHVMKAILFYSQEIDDISECELFGRKCLDLFLGKCYSTRVLEYMH